MNSLSRNAEKPNWLLRVFDGIVIAIALLFIAGHLNPGKALDPVTRHISSYASSAPWAWMILSCMVLLGIAYLMIAYGLIKHLHDHHTGAIAAVALAVAGALLFFVALYPTWVVGGRHASEIGYWERLWMALTSRTVDGMAVSDQIAAIHEQLIQSSTAFLLVAQVAVTWTLWRNALWSRHARMTVLLAGLALAAFALSKWQHDSAGLWQRIGFLFVLCWVWAVGRRFVTPPAKAQ